ncbi:hypothetical protein ACQPZJ_30020 [Actinoplanes sp. CA-054009]
MRFTSDTTTDGIRERDFTVGGVPGVLWAPPDATATTPLILMGHGGGTHKKAPAMSGRARLLIHGAACAVAVLDAPGHGDRPRTPHDEQEIAALFRAREAGDPEGPIVVRYNLHLAAQAVAEWQAALDALAYDTVGYFGLNMGTAIGIPLIARDPRVKAAVLGQFWPAPALAGGGPPDHHPDRVRPAVERRAHPPSRGPGLVRRLRLPGEDVARQRRHPQTAPTLRGRQRGPLLRPPLHDRMR